MANERCLMDIINDPDAFSQFFDSTGTELDGIQIGGADDMFGGDSGEDCPIFSLSADDDAANDDWMMPLAHSTSNLETPTIGPAVQPSLIPQVSSASVATVPYALSKQLLSSSNQLTFQNVSSVSNPAVIQTPRSSSTVLLTNTTLTGSLTAPQRFLNVGSMPAVLTSQAATVNVQYVQSSMPGHSAAHYQLIQPNPTTSKVQVLHQNANALQIAQTQVPLQQNVNTGAELTLIQMPNGQYAIQQSSQKQLDCVNAQMAPQFVDSGQLVLQQTASGIEQVLVQQQQPTQQHLTRMQLVGGPGGQILLQPQQQRVSHPQSGQITFQQQVQQHAMVRMSQQQPRTGLAQRPSQMGVGVIRGFQLPSGEVQIVGTQSAGASAPGTHQVVVQQPPTAMIVQGNSVGNSAVQMVNGQQIIIQQQPNTAILQGNTLTVGNTRLPVNGRQMILQQQPQSGAIMMQGNTPVANVGQQLQQVILQQQPAAAIVQGPGSQTQTQQIILQHPSGGNATFLQGNPAVVQQNTNVVAGNSAGGNSNVLYQTLPVAGNSRVISATNFVQINQFSGGTVQQPTDQQNSGFVLSMNQQAAAPAQLTGQMPDSSGNGGMLVQINGQTYRVNNVQQVMSPAPSPPLQIISAPPGQTPGQHNRLQQIVAQTPPHLQQQTVVRSGSPLIFAAQQQQPASVSVQGMQVIQPATARPTNSSNISTTLGTAGLVTMQQQQLASSPSRTAHQAIDAPLGQQAISLTPSQLAALQQASPGKQMKLLQILHRQQLQRAAASSSSSGHLSAGTNGQLTSVPAANTTSQIASQSQATTLQPLVTHSMASAPMIRPPAVGIAVQGTNLRLPGAVVSSSSLRPAVVVESAVPASSNSTFRPMLKPGMPPTMGASSPVRPIIRPGVAVSVQGPAVQAIASTGISLASCAPAVVMSSALSSVSSAAVRPPTTSAAGMTTAKVTTVQLTTQQQALLMKVQSHLQTLAALTQRTSEQDRFLQMLINAQQQILAQGQAQMQAASAVTTSVASAAIPEQKNAVLPVISTALMQPVNSAAAASVKVSLGTAIPNIGGATTLTSAACRPDATTGSMTKPAFILPSASSAVTSASPSKPVAGINQMEQFLQANPSLREKMEAQLAKMTPERREWFIRNQPLVFAKLQQQQQIILQQRKVAMAPVAVSAAVDVKRASVPVPVLPGQSVDGASVNALPTNMVAANQLTRKQLFQVYLLKDQKRATQPDWKTPFTGELKDILKRLVPYHVFQTRLDSDEAVNYADATFEEMSQQLLEKKDAMLEKYRRLLLNDSMRPEVAADAVMLGRMFINDERNQLKEDRQLATEHPELFIPRPVLKEDVVKSEEIKMEVGSPEDGDALSCKAELTVKTENNADSDGTTTSGGTNMPHSPAPLYSVHPSPAKGLTIVFKQCPSPNPTVAAHSPLNGSNDQIREVKVKLERCDDNAGAPSSSSPPSKRIRYNDSEEPIVDNSSLFANLTELSELENIEPTVGASEDEAAVAGLLNMSSHCFESYIDDSEPVIGDDTTTDDDLLAFSEVEANGDSLVTFGDSETTAVVGYSENVENDTSYQCDDVDLFTENVDQSSIGQNLAMTETSQPDGELMTAIGSLMADLGQVNEGARGNNSAQYSHASSFYTQASLHSRSAVVTYPSAQTASDEMQCAVSSIMDFQMDPFSSYDTSLLYDQAAQMVTDPTRGAESDLDAAVQSILS